MRSHGRLGWLAALALGFLSIAGGAHADELGDGKKALEKGDVETAMPLFRQAVQKDPERAEAHRYLGLGLEAQGEWEEALAAFDRAAELDPRSADAQRGRGAALAHLGEPEQAIAAYRSALELNKKYPRAALELGDLLIEQERADEAIDVFTMGLDWGRDTRPYFHEGIGRAEAERGNLKEAEVQILKAREMDPSNPRFHVALGDLYFDREIPSLARTSYQQALDLDPNNIQARYRMAAAYEKEALYNDALDQYKEVVRRNPRYQDAYLRMGKLYLLASDANPTYLDDAITNLEKYQELGGTDLEGSIYLARGYYKAKRYDEAESLLAPMSASGALDEEGHAVYARILYNKREFAASTPHFAEGVNRLNDTDFRRWAHALRTTNTAEGDARADSIYWARWEADSTAGVALERASDWLLESGKLRFQMGKEDSVQYAAAAVALERKIELDPEEDEAYYYLGLCRRQQDRYGEAVGPLRKAAELNPEKGDRHFWLAITYDKLDQKELAQESFRQAAAVDDSTVIGAIARQQLGYHCLVQKDYACAIDYLQRSSEISPKQSQTWVWLGQGYQNSGQKSLATQAYRKALELDPNQKAAKQGLAALSG